MLFTILFIHVFFGISANGSWIPYNLSAVIPTNYSSMKNSSTGIINGITQVNSNIIPAWGTYLYITLLAVWFAIFATNKGRKAFIGVAFLGLLTAIVMGGAGLVPPVIVGVSWGIFIFIMAIVLLIGE